MWKHRFHHGLQRCQYKRTKVIPGSSRFRTCYSSQNHDAVFPLRPLPSHWPTFCPLISRLSCTLYNILFIEHFAAEMLPLAFFNFKLSKFIVCYGVHSNVFLSVLSLIPSPSWTCLRRLEKCLNTHIAACSSCLFAVLGKQDAFPLLKSQLTITWKSSSFISARLLFLFGRV